MHTSLLLAGYGWLTVFGLAHFLVDVVARRLRHRHGLVPEAVLSYGLHATHALGQVMFGLLALRADRCSGTPGRVRHAQKRP